MNLPASIFAGVTGLGFLSYIIGIHSATYVRADGAVKQVGFLWAPNWTILFMVLFPLFFLVVAELVVFWKSEGRLKLSADGDNTRSDLEWSRNVETSSYSYWAVFLICVVFAGLFQWIGVDLIPLIKGGADYATSLGHIGHCSSRNNIGFRLRLYSQRFAYLYMCLCFYLFFAGLILLYTMVHDLWKISGRFQFSAGAGIPTENSNDIGLRLMRGIFRCTILALLVAICMKAQSAYLSSNQQNIVAWIADDMSSAFHPPCR